MVCKTSITNEHSKHIRVAARFFFFKFYSFTYWSSKSSIEEDYIPFILHMEKITALIPTEKCKAYFGELIDKLRSRCDNRYAAGEVVASTFLFDDEMAELTTHMAYLLLLVEPVKK